MLTLAAYEAATHWTIRVKAQAAVQVAPWTVRQISYDSAGKAVEDRTTYERSDGPRAMTGVFPSHPERGVMHTVQFANGAAMTLFDAIHLKMSGYRTAREMADLKAIQSMPKPASCAYPNDKVLGSSTTLVGVAVSEVETPVSSHRHLEWRAPALGCYPLEIEDDLLQPDGSYAKSFTMKVVSVQLGEPDDKPFAESEYREAKPSDIHAALLAYEGEPAEQCPTCSQRAADIDQAYSNRQNPSP